VKIGDALKKLFANGVVKREEMWITSKLWFVLFIFTYSCLQVKIFNYIAYVCKQLDHLGCNSVSSFELSTINLHIF
jgi:hypothetical protein